MTDTILITDYAWPDVTIERAVIESAGFRLVVGAATPASADAITALVNEHQPAAILTCWARVNAEAIVASAPLRHVGRIGVGLDNIDVDACTARGIPVTNVPDYCVEEVSDHALALALAWARGVVTFDRAVHAGRWDPAQAQLRRVRDLVVGIVGYGRIGQATARKFGAFGCRLLAHSRTAPAQPDPAVGFVALPDLLAQADIVVLNVPLTAQTKHLFDAAQIAAMKPGALLINVSRGGVVDTQAVIDALQRGHLGGAALDVLEHEPEVPAALLAQPNAVITPHVAFSSDASLAELRRRAAEEAVRVLRGQAPQHRCNTPQTSAS
jgi:D-3-phosphoglycerate dehydrogenase